MSSLLAQGVAWKEQVALHGDVAPAIARDLAIVARQTSEARGRVQREQSPIGAELLHAGAEIIAIAAPCSTPAPALAAAAAAPRSRSRGPTAPMLPASSQLVPGAQLAKAYGGKTHVVEVTVGGFIYDGVQFTSLSAVAKHITGTHWNGLLFFGLRRRKTYPDKAARRG
jgi:hypothetical protein